MIEPRIDKRTKISHKREKFAYAVSEYKKGKKSTYEIGREIGVSGTTVRKWLKYALVPRKVGHRKYSIYLWDEIVEKYENGLSCKELSEEYGISEGTIRVTLSNLGAYKAKCKKRIAQIKDGEVIKVYQSMTEASKELGCSISAISKACGKDKTCKGYRWEIWTNN